jgi:hypothetical protein
MTHKSRKSKNPVSAGCSLLRAEGFFRNLDVLYGGLGIGKFYFGSTQKIFPNCKFF